MNKQTHINDLIKLLLYIIRSSILPEKKYQKFTCTCRYIAQLYIYVSGVLNTKGRGWVALYSNISVTSCYLNWFFNKELLETKLINGTAYTPKTILVLETNYVITMSCWPNRSTSYETLLQYCIKCQNINLDTLLIQNNFLLITILTIHMKQFLTFTFIPPYMWYTVTGILYCFNSEWLVSLKGITLIHRR